MLVTTAAISIAPGQLAPATREAVRSLCACDAGRHCLWLRTAELGEVNTLLALFDADAFEAVGAWLRELSAGPAGPLLRHTDFDVHATEATPDALRAVGHHAVPALLLQVLGARSAFAPRACVELAPRTGRQGRRIVLTSARTHDEALALATHDVHADEADVLDSSLWLPIPLQPHISAST